MGFEERAAAYRDRIEAALDRTLPGAAVHPSRLHEALRYAVLGGGKRLRPLLAYATGEWLGLPAERIDPVAVAIELVHAYSLVHDDLPAMDDDDMRRGRATTHVAFDEATAILVGDALQVLAYDVLATDAALAASAAVRRVLVLDLAHASGTAGMAGGQAMDMGATGRRLALPELEELHARKTGRLLQAAVIMPCRLRPDLAPADFDAAKRFGAAIGLAFQVADDILDLESPPEVSGKPRGSDVRNHKATFPSVIGLEASQQRLAVLREEALMAVARLGASADGLRMICDAATRRDR
jgi:farnesyl diphosphate synthase